MKFARRWLYTKGVMVPEEDKNPVDNELESFLQNAAATASGRSPMSRSVCTIRSP